MSEPDNSQAPATDDSAPGTSELRPGDYYFDGPYLVFTEAYHLPARNLLQLRLPALPVARRSTAFRNALILHSIASA